MAAEEMVTREEFRTLRQDVSELRKDLGEMRLDVAVLRDWMSEVRSRNRALPGWLLTAVGIALPLIGSLATMWLAGKVPVP